MAHGGVQLPSVNHNLVDQGTLKMPLVFSTPPLSTTAAHSLTLLFAFCYVAPLYLWKNARVSFGGNHVQAGNGTRGRDDTAVIRARLVTSVMTTILCCGIVFGLLRHFVGDSVDVGPSLLSGDISDAPAVGI